MTVSPVRQRRGYHRLLHSCPSHDLRNDICCSSSSAKHAHLPAKKPRRASNPSQQELLEQAAAAKARAAEAELQAAALLAEEARLLEAASKPSAPKRQQHGQSARNPRPPKTTSDAHIHGKFSTQTCMKERTSLQHGFTTVIFACVNTLSSIQLFEAPSAILMPRNANLTYPPY